MTNDRRLASALRAGLAAALAAAGLIVASAAAVAQVTIPQPAFGPVVAPAPQAAMIVPQLAFPQADGAADAIGDPWWDEAEAKPPVAGQAPDAEAEDAEAEEPADARAMLQA